ncbi:Toll-like receptor 6, partial [Lamellibrachia satsuma]
MAKLQVDISGNPLHCLCNNTDFVSWIKNSKAEFLNKYNTFCIGNDNSKKHLFRFDSEELMNVCHLDNVNTKTDLRFTVLSPLVIVVISTFLCVVYIYRWKCVHLCSRPRRVSVSPDVELDHVVYERDAFICYNSIDREWVLTELLTRLKENNISSIIHDIDFLPGASVINIIGESMERSRFTVLVLSPDFLSSNWCLFELDSARTHAISLGRDVIVPIILREIPTAPNSRHLADIFDKSYLKWTGSQEGNSVFWDKLITKLKHGGNIT